MHRLFICTLSQVILSSSQGRNVNAKEYVEECKDSALQSQGRSISIIWQGTDWGVRAVTTRHASGSLEVCAARLGAVLCASALSTAVNRVSGSSAARLRHLLWRSTGDNDPQGHAQGTANGWANGRTNGWANGWSNGWATNGWATATNGRATNEWATNGWSNEWAAGKLIPKGTHRPSIKQSWQKR